MKATHKRLQGGKICYFTTKHEVDAYMIEYAIKLLIQNGNNKPKKSDVISEIKYGLKQYGGEGFYGRLDIYDGSETKAYNEHAEALAKKLFPTFY